MHNFFLKVKNVAFAICCVLIISSPVTSYAGKASVPDTIAGTTKVDAEGLINLLNDTPELVIIDSRMDDRSQGYIESSVSLPDVDTTCTSLSKLIKTKSTPTAFYCNGVKCGRSIIASRIALKCGYKKIYWYRGGFSDWKEKGYPYISTK